MQVGKLIGENYTEICRGEGGGGGGKIKFLHMEMIVLFL
jgi:hypothetical protein